MTFQRDGLSFQFEVGWLTLAIFWTHWMLRMIPTEDRVVLCLGPLRIGAKHR